MLFSFAKIRFNLKLVIRPERRKFEVMSEDDSKKKEKLHLILRKRRIPLAHPYLKGGDAKRNTGSTNTRIFAYKHFETDFSVKAGDVYLARFPLEFGSELHGDHFVAVLLDSTPVNPLITVAPLKSERAKELNPASDLRLGIIKGINSGHRTVAVINQLRAIDKRRLLSEEAINDLHSQFQKNLIKDYDEVCVETINKYRLTREQYNLLKKTVLGYIANNYINHDEE